MIRSSNNVRRVRRPRSRKRAAIAWTSAGILACIASATLAPEAGWIADLIANLAAQWVLVGVALAIALGIARQWAPSVAAVGVTGLFLLSLMGGRATHTSREEAAAAGASLVRVLHLNMNSLNPRAPEVFDLILGTDADVVSVLEPSTELVQRLRESEEIKERYAEFYIVPQARAGWPIVMTRWPQRGGPDWTPGPLWRTIPRGGEGYVMKVERPEGAFFMLQSHASSPRSPRRWNSGSELVAGLAKRVRTTLQPEGLPIVLACDLNGTPSGGRSRRLVNDCSLRRAKPLLTPLGTYPSALPWPLTLAIDDVFVSPDVTVVAWETIDVPGSDHRGVLVTLALPAGR